MRKILIVFICSLSFSLLSAQTFSGAIILGANMSQIDGDDLAGFRRLGLNVGARVSAKLYNKWNWSMELLYTQQGASRSKDDLINIYDQIKMNFVEAPLMINYQDWKILASIGVSYGRLINYTVTSITGEDLTEQELYKTDIVSIVVGSTFFFSEKWGLNIRWSKHLTDFRENNPEQYFRGRNLAVRLYYLL